MQAKVQEHGPHVVEVTDADFEQVVIEGSKERPVVVDLWAAWCGPCRTLGPMLEKIAGERDGAFLLAKVDIDANPVGQALLNAVRSQGIPTVVAFRDGQAVNMFIGAYPEPALNEFIDSVLPAETDHVVADARDGEERGDVAAAEAAYRTALEEDPNNASARIGLGRILVERGDLEGGREVLMPALPDPDAERLLARISVAEWATSTEPGTLASAKRLAAQGRWREALDGMLGSLADDPDARQAMLEAFAVLGDEDELAQEYRRRLAAALF